jgi:hypothetical protein
MITAASPSRSATPPAPPLQVASVRLPLGFVLVGILSLVVGVGCLVAWPDLLASYHYNQYIIAVTHLFTLGWISSIVMGAMYQLVPVALETTLYSERLARGHFALHLVGVAGMVSMFWMWEMKAVAGFGSVFGLGVILFVYNIGRTLARIPRWNVIAAAITSALCWLVLTMLAGLVLAASKSSLSTQAELSQGTIARVFVYLNRFAPMAQMHAHAHLGVIGFFLMMTVGVSYKLAPMFTLSDLKSARRASASIWLLNLGLAGVIPSILVQSRFKVLFALVIAGGLALYALELWAILRGRKRRVLDWGMRYFVTALGALVAASILGVVLSWPNLPLTAFTGQLENVYGFVALIGVITFAVVGMLYKIVPFLVWYASYSKLIGRKKVPSLAELYWPQVQAVGYVFYVSGLTVTAIAIALANVTLVRGGCALLGVSILLFLVNVARILSHIVKPRIEPLIREANHQPANA